MDTPNSFEKAGSEPEEEEVIGEFQVAEYIIYLLSLDTYMRYAKEKVGDEEAEDAIIRKGLRILRMADQDLENLKSFLAEHLSTPSQKKMLDRAISIRSFSPDGAARRALQFRTLLSRGGSATMNGLFKGRKYVQQVREAISASMLDDADKALDVLAALPMRNVRMRDWIDLAAKQAGSGEFAPSAVDAGSKESDQTADMVVQGIQQLAATGAEESQQAQEARSAMLDQVERDARDAAKRSMDVNQIPDEPLTRSETVGVAVAAAAAALSDPSRTQNIPEPLRELDDEQRAAALTDGRVLVAASAGTGKSTTLVARTTYLVKDRVVFPGRILATSFNSKAAAELKSKVAAKLGDSYANQMSGGGKSWTMHSIFKKQIMAYGNAEEKSAMSGDPQKVGGVVATTVQRIWGECYDEKERPIPARKEMEKIKTQWSGNGISPAEAKKIAKGETEVDAAEWYTMYEGLKGSIPGWEPPCEELQKEVAEEEYQKKLDRWRRDGQRGRMPQRKGTTFESFLNRMRPNGERLGDFDDMLTMFRDILNRNPGVKSTIQKTYDHVMVDECQDLNQVQFDIIMGITEHITPEGKNSLWMVGDDKQCVASDTPITVERVDGGGSVLPHTVAARDLEPGMKVLSYRNGGLVPQTVRHVAPSSWTWGYKVTTESGKTLTMSPNHKIWAHGPNLSEGQMAVYLMYRKDLGFRVGITNKCRDEEYLNSFGGRAFMEKAERMWVLEVCADREEALLAEVSYSLKYGVPTMVFGGENRGINQERVDAIFANFGRNGVRVLEAKNLSFDLPHWMSQSYTKHGRDRRTVQMIAHGAKGTQVTLEWSGDDLDSQLGGTHFVKNEDGRRRVRKWFTNYREALSFAERLADTTKANLSRRLSTDDGPLRLLTASGIFPGMGVAVYDGEELVQETVVSVEKVDSVFVDLDVDDASNFFGGGILSHNSIYEFRGAKPELFRNLAKEEDWKVRTIQTNYRCEPEIVDAANKLISNNQNQIEMQTLPSPHKPRGVGSVVVMTPATESEAALGVIEQVKQDAQAYEEGDDRNLFYGDNAVLCRTNSELNAYEAACIIRGVPYSKKGAASFFNSAETRTVLGYVQLVTGDDNEKMQKALGAVINKPNRFFVNDEAATKAVDEAVREYAKLNKLRINEVNPTAALRESDFRKLLIQKLAPSARPGSYGHTQDLERLSDMARSIDEMQANTSLEGFKTRDMFDSILALKGRQSKVDAKTGKTEWVDVTIRDTISASKRDAAGADADEDEEGDDTRQLGNVSFLYELAKPDPTDPGDVEHDPSTPNGFRAKMSRFAARARVLNVEMIKDEEERKKKERQAVYIGTVHSVKGDQWSTTYVQLPLGKFPLMPRPKPGEPPISEEDMNKQLESERRLGYVALTRAKKNLIVICPSEVGGMKAGVSRFVHEADLKLGENVVRPGVVDPPNTQLPAPKLATAEVEYD